MTRRRDALGGLLFALYLLVVALALVVWLVVAYTVEYFTKG